METGLRDGYWRLHTYQCATIPEMRGELLAHGHHVGQRVRRDGLRALCQRVSRGLPLYPNFSVRELRQFAYDRGLLQNPKSADKETLVETLEAADEEKQFKYLLDLPAELRLQVYQLYLNEFNLPLQQPTQPPLARVCSLIRIELLPLFYSTCLFDVECELVYGARTKKKKHVVLEPATEAYFLELAAARYIDSLRNLRFCIRACPLSFHLNCLIGYRRKEFTVYGVDPSFSSSSSSLPLPALSRSYPPEIDRIVENVNLVFRDILARGPQQFRFIDLATIRLAIANGITPN